MYSCLGVYGRKAATQSKRKVSWLLQCLESNDNYCDLILRQPKHLPSGEGETSAQYYYLCMIEMCMDDSKRCLLKNRVSWHPVK